LAKDLLHPSPEEEKRRHKKKRLVQSPNSYFMDVKCPGCYKITTVFSHAQTVVLCVGCSTVLCQPTGGKARLTEGQVLIQEEAALTVLPEAGEEGMDRLILASPASGATAMAEPVVPT
ncbi:hypothetical protein CCH79_00008676, partial [Gambusia affinis]